MAAQGHEGSPAGGCWLRWVRCFIVGCCALGATTGEALPADEHTFGGKTYGLVSTDTTVYSGYNFWDSARRWAELHGGQLATVEDSNLNAWLQSTFGPKGRAWIGLYYEGAPDSDANLAGLDWKWLGTDSPEPLYRNFDSPLYPRQGTGWGGRDYAMMDLSTGLWVDDHPPYHGGSHLDLYWGIYEADHASVVPIVMNVPVHAFGDVVRETDADSGTNHAKAVASYWEKRQAPAHPTALEVEHAEAFASIDCDGNAWGGRILSWLYLVNYEPLHDNTAGTYTNPQGALTIGSSEKFPTGTHLTLHLNAKGDCDPKTEWQFILKREDKVVLLIQDTLQAQIPVEAGDSLTVEFTHSLTSDRYGRSVVALNFWTVPEPATLLLLTASGLMLITHRRL